MISELGAGLVVIALGIALIMAMFGRGSPGSVAGFAIVFYGLGWLLARVTGGANPLGGAGAIFAYAEPIIRIFV